MEHLSTEQREAMIASIKLTCDYFCDYSTDAGLFGVQALLATQAAHLASRLACVGDFPGQPPSDMAIGMAANVALRPEAIQLGVT